jgi:hypothetical protein
MDSTDIINSLVLRPDDLPPEAKEMLSRMQPGDKINITDGTFTLIENGEKVIHFGLNEGDSLTISADPSSPQSVTFKMGDVNEESAPRPEEEGDESDRSAAVESMKTSMYEQPVPE